ncbi:MFS transporter [Brevundimonas sp.]|uniref:MFS transporter n=1 Tax=Brevundimonas sp. TaxID=1871086 RepID=UPI0025BE93BB|nr:MFS transporter [Brevundimonas sp.]
MLGLGQAVAFASSYYLLGVMADPAAVALGIGTASVFLALSGAFLVSAVLTPYAGQAIERIGGARVLAASNLAFAVALLLMAAAPHPLVLCIGVVLLGIGMAAGLYGTAFAVLVEMQGQGARRAIAAVSLLGALGGALGWPISREVLDMAGWRAAFGFWAALHLFVCLPIALIVLPQRKAGADAVVDKSPMRWTPTMIRMAIFFAGAWAVASAMAAHLPRLLVDLGMTVERAAWAAGLMAASAMVVRLLDITVLHRSHPILTARLAALFHPVGALIATLFGTVGAPAVAIGQGMGNGFLSVASGALPLKVFGAERYGMRQALILTPARYVQAAAPAAYALAMDASPGVALAVSSAICLGMFALSFSFREGSSA